LAQAILAWVAAHKGFPEQAHRAIGNLLALAQQLTLGSQRCLAHVCAASAYALLRDVRAVAVHADRSLTVAGENDLPHHTGTSRIFRSWALALQGGKGEEIAELREGLAGPRFLAQHGRKDDARTRLAALYATLPRASTPPICRTPRRCWTRCNRFGPRGAKRRHTAPHGATLGAKFLNHFNRLTPQTNRAHGAGWAEVRCMNLVVAASRGVVSGHPL